MVKIAGNPATITVKKYVKPTVISITTAKNSMTVVIKKEPASHWTGLLFNRLSLSTCWAIDLVRFIFMSNKHRRRISGYPFCWYLTFVATTQKKFLCLPTFFCFFFLLIMKIAKHITQLAWLISSHLSITWTSGSYTVSVFQAVIYGIPSSSYSFHSTYNYISLYLF